MRKRWPSKSSARNSRKIKEKLFTKINTLFYILGLTFGLFLHGEDINVVNGHNIEFRVCHMDLPGPTTSVGTRTDYSVGPWDYPTCAARYVMV
jgi:hypothetical protein